MKKITFTFLSLLFALLSVAQTKEKPVESKIKEVTVFLQGAQVVRTVDTQLSIGKTVLKLTGLSPDVEAESISVKGNDNFKLISVEHNENYIEKPKVSLETKALTEQIEEVELKLASIENEIAILKEKEAFLKSNTNITGGDKSISPSDYKALTDYYASQIKEIRTTLLEKTLAKKKTNEELEKLTAQKTQLSRSDKINTSEILVTLLGLKENQVKFEVSYYVDKAKWEPSYDVRVDKIGAPLQLTYKANIEQNTGVDWKDVIIKLSNAKHDNLNTFEELETSYITFYEPQQITEVLQGRAAGVEVIENSGSPGSSPTIRIRGLGAVNSSDPLIVVDGVVASSLSNLNPSMVESISVLKDASSTAIYGSRGSNGVVFVTTKKGGLIDKSITEKINIAYEIGSPVTVLSDKPMSTFDIKSTDVPANYLYKCAPAQSKHVFAMARVANWEKLKLLDGESNLFYQQTYIGTSKIDTKYVSDTLDFNLGQEKNIVVKRKQLADFNANQTIGNKRIVTKGYEIEVRNNKNTTAEIELYELIPLSTDKSITIDVLEISGAKHNLATGILTWKLKLSPGETKKLNVKYEVKYPKGKLVSME